MATPDLIHLGIIADGNRRWAKMHNLPALEGHRKGSEVVKMIIRELLDSEVKYLSFFIFSTDNWNRSPEEVAYLMKLAGQSIKDMAKEAKKNHIRIKIQGRPERVQPRLWQDLQQIEQDTIHNTGLTVCFCFNYGGQWEIVDAAKQAHAAGETDWTPESFHKYLYQPDLPDCDFIVRTSGEERLSGFQLWRAAYSELLFLDKYFPALEPADVKSIIDQYHLRQRRFGK